MLSYAVPFLYIHTSTYNYISVERIMFAYHIFKRGHLRRKRKTRSLTI